MKTMIGSGLHGMIRTSSSISAFAVRAEKDLEVKVVKDDFLLETGWFICGVSIPKYKTVPQKKAGLLEFAGVQGSDGEEKVGGFTTILYSEEIYLCRRDDVEAILILNHREFEQFVVIEKQKQSRLVTMFNWFWW